MLLLLFRYGSRKTNNVVLNSCCDKQKRAAQGHVVFLFIQEPNTEHRLQNKVVVAYNIHNDLVHKLNTTVWG